MPAPDTPRFDESTRLLLAEVELGFKVEDFARSVVGRYLLGRAAEEVERAMEELKKVEPTDAKAITNLQNVIWRGESFAVWIQDTIEGAKNAEEALRQQEDGQGE